MTRYLLLALTVLAAPAAAQITATLPVTCNASGSICTQATPVTNPDGTTIGAGGGGGTPTGAAGSPNAAVVSVQGVTNGTPQRVTGTSLSGATDDGTAPNKVAGVYRSTSPTFTDGQRGDLQLDANGNLMTKLTGNLQSDLDAWPNSRITIIPSGNNGTTPGKLGVAPSLYNGTTWDRAPGNTVGAFVLNKGAVTLTTVQVSVGTTATLVVAARTGRSRLVITQAAAGPCYYSSSATVSATTGARMTAAGASKTYQYAGALYGICPGGAVTTDVDEEF